MKLNKTRFKEAVLDLLLELVLTLLCFGAGALILHLFGIDLDDPSVNSDLVVLLGFALLIVLPASVFALVWWIRKKKKKNKENDP